MILTTSTIPDSLPLGIVVACIPYAGSTYVEGIKDLRGRTQAGLPDILEKRRYEALRRLSGKAELMGADAVMDVRFDTREITSSWRELCAYGTAAIVRRTEGPTWPGLSPATSTPAPAQ
jgi:uncharacterized protein YbjQ (UPF0145 family)